MITKYEMATKANQYFFEKRKAQNQNWMFETIEEQLKTNFYEQEDIKLLINQNKKAVQNNEISPFFAAQLILKKYFGK